MSNSWGSVVVVAASLCACTVYRFPEVHELPRPIPPESVVVSTPVKVHLLSGATVVYPRGLRVVNGLLLNPSPRQRPLRYDLTLQNATPVDSAIPLDSVMAFETFRNSIDAPASIALSLVGTAATAVAAGVLAVAIFGSCPTVYTDSAGTPALEAEGFSYSIAPLFEARDVDALRGGADSTGVLRLEIRNEAMETHYITRSAYGKSFAAPRSRSCRYPPGSRSPCGCCRRRRPPSIGPGATYAPPSSRPTGRCSAPRRRSWIASRPTTLKTRST